MLEKLGATEQEELLICVGGGEKKDEWCLIGLSTYDPKCKQTKSPSDSDKGGSCVTNDSCVGCVTLRLASPRLVRSLWRYFRKKLARLLRRLLT